tara:strand:+ start:11144 stop:11509 length:366 start_codon:yes stop_codon:yes gene_type:complete
MKKMLTILLVPLLLLLAGCSSTSISQEKIDTFAKCLTEAEATMFGTFWCPHCAKTKKKFGSSFQYINYVECDPRGDDEQSEYCIEKEIDKYDTWEFKDGSRIISEPTFQQLSEKTGCAVPE